MAVVIVLFVGIAVAVAKPGDLGGDDHQEQAASTTTTVLVTTTTAAAPATTTTTAPVVTTAPSSGLVASGTGSASARGLAATGGELWALPGGALLALALAIRRVLATR